MHVFRREFLERALASSDALPFHIARKIVPYWTPAEGAVQPAHPNALKFERFIFDVLPWSDRCLIVEADRESEFHPVKNRDGADSPTTAREAMQALYRRWVRRQGGVVADDVPIEISPLVALAAEDLASRVRPGQVFSEPVDWSRP
jgi:UDP-N-acetylglucosamine/UDP-N-acetylgalactosamine diphosphorylase